MDKEEARAYKNGIDFRVPSKKLTISAKRDMSGEIIVTKHLSRKKEISPIRALEEFIVILIFSLFLSFILTKVEGYRAKICIIMGAIWLLTFGDYFYRSKKKSEYPSYRYHAAEHKALNYLDRYHTAPREITFLMNQSSYSVRCGSTLIAVLYTLVTLCTLVILFAPSILVGMFGCIFSAVIVFILWAFELLNFFQRFVIMEPTQAELEVALVGLKEYVKILKEEEKNEKVR